MWEASAEDSKIGLRPMVSAVSPDGTVLFGFGLVRTSYQPGKSAARWRNMGDIT
jgi:hypothetical protein